MRRAASIAVLSAACAGSSSEVPAPIDPKPDLAPVNAVATTVRVADDDDGFDLDGDGGADNALAALALPVDALVAERFAANVHVLVLQLSGHGDLLDDPSVSAALFPAVDTDSDGADNASGTELFDATGFVDADGVALSRAPAALVDGAWTAALDDPTFQVGSITFAVGTPVHIDAALTEAGMSGRLGVGVTIAALADTLAQEGVDASLVDLIAGFADLDLDDDGAPEAVSMAFTFEAARCDLASAP